MALIKCSECGKEISDESQYCMHCGGPIKKKKKYKDLTKEETKKVDKYKSKNKVYWTLHKLLTFVFDFIALIFLVLFFTCHFKVIFLMFAIVFLALSYLFLCIVNKDNSAWYEEHVDELYKNKVIK